MQALWLASTYRARSLDDLRWRHIDSFSSYQVIYFTYKLCGGSRMQFRLYVVYNNHIPLLLTNLNNNLALLHAGKPARLNLPASARQHSNEFLCAQPELAILRDRLEQHLFSGTYDGGSHLPADVPTNPAARSTALAHMGLEDLITVLPGGYLVGWPVWATDDSEPGQLQVCVCSLGINFRVVTLN